MLGFEGAAHHTAPTPAINTLGIIFLLRLYSYVLKKYYWFLFYDRKYLRVFE